MTGHRRGPRPADGDTASRVLRAARQTFAEEGYAGASTRKIALRAGVDAALVHYYFGTKDNLFRRAVDGEPAPRARQDQDTRAAVRAFLAHWDRAGNRERLLALLRSLGESDHATRALRALLPGRAHELPLGAGLLGLAIMRYLLRVEPLASMPAEHLETLLQPLLDKTADDTPGRTA